MIKEFCLLLLCWVLVLNHSYASNNTIINLDKLCISLASDKSNEFINLADQQSDTVRIPLIRAGNLFFIEAEIDGEFGNFLVDLGAPYLVLNSTYFRSSEIDPSYTSITISSETVSVQRTQVKKLSIFGIQYKNVSADLTDLGTIENKRGIKILGLLGVSLFKDYVFDLDVKKQQLLLYKSSKSSIEQSDQMFTIPLRIQNNVLLVKAMAKGVSLNLSIDSGAERNILANTLPSEVYDGMNVLGNSSITDGNGGRSEALLSELKDLTVGDVSLNKMKTLIINLDLISRAYGRKIDGMLGYPFFASGRVVIDFKKKKLVLYQRLKMNNG